MSPRLKRFVVAAACFTGAVAIVHAQESQREIQFFAKDVLPLPRPNPGPRSPLPTPPWLPEDFGRMQDLGILRDFEAIAKTLYWPSPPNAELVCEAGKVQAVILSGSPRKRSADPVVVAGESDESLDQQRDRLRQTTSVIGQRMQEWMYERGQVARLKDAAKAIGPLREKTRSIIALTQAGSEWPDLSDAVGGLSNDFKPVHPALKLAFQFYPDWKRVRRVAGVGIGEIIPINVAHCETQGEYDACLRVTPLHRRHECENVSLNDAAISACATTYCTTSSTGHSFCEAGKSARGSGCRDDGQAALDPYFAVALGRRPQPIGAITSGALFLTKLDELAASVGAAEERFSSSAEADRAFLQPILARYATELAKETQALDDNQNRIETAASAIEALEAILRETNAALAAASARVAKAIASVDAARLQEEAAALLSAEKQTTVEQRRLDLDRALANQSEHVLICDDEMEAGASPVTCPDFDRVNRYLERRYELLQIVADEQARWISAFRSATEASAWRVGAQVALAEAQVEFAGAAAVEVVLQAKASGSSEEIERRSQQLLDDREQQASLAQESTSDRVRSQAWIEELK